MVTLKDLLARAAAALGGGRPDLALPLLRPALLVQPDAGEAWHLLGVARHQAGAPADGLRQIARAARLAPDHPTHAISRAIVLRALGRGAEAVTWARHALAGRTGPADAYTVLGNTLADLDDRDAAAGALRAALALDPALPLGWRNLGNLARAGRWLDRALRLAPDDVDTLRDAANLLADGGRLRRAAALYRRALTRRPGRADILSNLGTLLGEQHHTLEALDAGRAAALLDPGFATAYNLVANQTKLLGDTGRAARLYRRAIAIDPDFAIAHSNLLFCLHNDPTLDGAALFTEHRAWAERHARPRYRFIRPHENDRDPDRPLRIGYVSGDFRDHPIMRNQGALQGGHDRGGFAVYCYSESGRVDAVTRAAMAGVDGWRQIGSLSDRAAAELIRADRIDILVFLAGHIGRNRLTIAALKPAPVQVSFGDLGTSAMSTMDHLIVDRWLVPADERFEESLWELPCFEIYRPPAGMPAATGRAAGPPTFGSFNNPAKLNEQVIALWATLLRATPDARLLLKYHHYFGLPPLRRRIGDAFAAHGIERARLALQPAADSAEAHLALYREVDVALDPFPFTGNQTTLEALWMGVPVVTLRGPRYLGRFGASILGHAGLSHLVADGAAAYVAIARRLMADAAGRATLRGTLRARLAASALRDERAYVRSFEAAFRAMWRRWCAGLAAPAPPLL